ncbi:hypothetical protein ABIB40_001677 [Pedobacter sp. UYP30]|uniref:hypothetical protein n=1 Tax=Pedobacter sp. UYP30 TaxID=1756400 RepID=UPI003393254F
MRAQFRIGEFNQERLLEFKRDVEQPGITVGIFWQKGRKAEENQSLADGFGLSVNGTLVFNQLKKNGTMLLGFLPEHQETTFLHLLQKHRLYDDPNWALGILALVGYIIFELCVIASRDEKWLQITLFACFMMVVIFLIVAFFHAEGKVNNNVYKVLGVFGAIGYILTALASVLALPFFTCIGQRKMETRMANVPLSPLKQSATNF